MVTNRFLLLVLAALVGNWPDTTLSAEEPYQPRPSSQSVGTLYYQWHDAARNRDVPVKIYYPSAATEGSPVVIFSHGLGGNREGYEYLGRHWAGCGYVSVHIQHFGSDESVWKNVPRSEVLAKMVEAANNRPNVVNRAKDISFVIDQLVQLNT
jgi:predicted dienelactone hydrolase